MAIVWERSKAKGSNLLVLLAIADCATDEGRDAFPRFDTLARKTRMTERAVRLIVDRLVDEHELTVQKNDDRRPVLGGFIPRYFFHVKCCQNVKSFQKSKSENFSGNVNGGSQKSERAFRNIRKIHQGSVGSPLTPLADARGAVSEPVSKREFRAAEKERARYAKAYGRSCPHEPRCESPEACILAFVDYRRARMSDALAHRGRATT